MEPGTSTLALSGQQQDKEKMRGLLHKELTLVAA